MKTPFENIKLTQLYILYKTITETEIRDVSNIKRKYLENALAFEETLLFLENLKIIENNSGELFLLKTQFQTCNSINDFKEKFISVLFSTNDEVSLELKNFFLNFQMDSDKTYFIATEIEKIKFSNSRNLLLELEFITVSPDNTTYFINPLYSDLFIKQFNRRKLSPENLKKKLSAHESIGLIAEKAIIDYEVRRLTDIKLSPFEIEHTSQINALAGYDIASFENHLNLKSKRINRYIEVKAVSIENFKFYWSKHEIEIAKVFGETYYLYLLPVDSSEKFNFEKIMIICNPFKKIYSNGGEWNKEVEIVSFHLNYDITP